MCGTCGCANEAHDHLHEQVSLLDGVRSEARRVRVEWDVLRKSSQLAERNRTWFVQRQVLAINFVSSPGSGKTTLLERTIRESGLGGRTMVIQGDQATDRDAERIRQAGARA